MEAGLNHPAAFFDLGMILSASNPEKAMRYLSKALGHPDFGLAAHMLTAQIHENLGRFSEAALSYLKALSLADTTTIEESQADELLQTYEPILETQGSVTDEATLKKPLQKYFQPAFPRGLARLFKGDPPAATRPGSRNFSSSTG